MHSGGSRRGFTLVELLIAIVVIAILAAITVVAFRGIQERAIDAAIKNDFAGLNKQIRLYQAINGRLPGVIGGSQGQIDQVRFKPTRAAYDQSTSNFFVCFGGSWGQTPSKDTYGFRALSINGTHHAWRSDIGYFEDPDPWAINCGELVNGGGWMFVTGRNSGDDSRERWTTTFR